MDFYDTPKKKKNKKRSRGVETISMIREMHQLNKTMISLRLSQADYNAIKERSNLFCLGNVSKWLVYAAKKYQPSQNELIKLQPKKKI